MIIRQLSTALISGVLLLPLNSYGADNKKIYFGGSYGLAKIKDETRDVASALVSGLGGSVTVTQDSSIGNGRVFIGYRFTENTDFEVGYFQTNSAEMTASGRTGGAVSYSANLGVEANGYDVSALFRPSKASGANNFYVRLGVQSSDLKFSGSVTAGGTTVNLGSTTSSGSGLLFGFGYDIEFDSFFLRAEASRYDKIGGESAATFYGLGAGLRF